MYKIKEIYNTIQCEGFHTGRVAIFCRFTGCNLWSGREKDRSKAICDFCDTDFVGTDGPLGGKYTAATLADQINQLWPKDTSDKFVVFTGGEPLLQLDTELISEIHEYGFEIAIETNGTLQAPEGIDWISLSPKSKTKIVLEKTDEIKIVFPQMDCFPKDFKDFKAEHFYLQPMDNSQTELNTKLTIEYIKNNPKWKLSIQLHKILGID